MTIKEANRLHVIKQIEEGRLTIKKAAEMLGLSRRQISRIKKRYFEKGAVGVISHRVGQTPGNSVSIQTKETILSLLRKKYYECGPTFASEKLEELDKIKVSREWLRQFMIKEGLWEAKKAKEQRMHRRRNRRKREGELEQIDGSYHAWFEDRGEKCCVLAVVDDATSKLKGLRFCEHETTEDYMELIKDYIIAYGKPLAFYSDKHQIFRVNNGCHGGKSQLGRALNELEIELICAHSPQAKGRVERKNGVLQDRLIKEMRLKGISTIEDANQYASEYVEKHNRRFGKEAEDKMDAHILLPPGYELEKILVVKEIRKLSKKLTMQFENNLYQIEVKGQGRRLQGAAVEVLKRKDKIIIQYQGRELPYTTWKDNAETAQVMDRKHIQAFLDRKKPMTIIERHRRKIAMNF